MYFANFAVVMFKDIELMIKDNQELPSTPLTSEQSFLMSHSGLALENTNTQPSPITAGTYSVRLNITQQQPGFRWLYVDVIYLNLTDLGPNCSQGSHLAIFRDGDKNLLCEQNNTNPIHYLPLTLTSQHGYAAPYVDFQLNLWQQDTPKRGFILYYKGKTIMNHQCFFSIIGIANWNC